MDSRSRMIFWGPIRFVPFRWTGWASCVTGPKRAPRRGRYTRAAELGSADAQFNLGLFAQSGRAGTQDLALAVQWCPSITPCLAVLGCHRPCAAKSNRSDGDSFADHDTLYDQVHKVCANGQRFCAGTGYCMVPRLPFLLYFDSIVSAQSAPWRRLVPFEWVWGWAGEPWVLL